MVLKAGSGSSPTAAEAMARLCEAYWHPIYAYIRRRGFNSDAASDLTQEFFARILEGDDLGDVAREKGRFRAFLLASVNHFLSNEYDRSRAQKRGGGCSILPLEFETAEGVYQFEPAHQVSPEAVYQRRWALTLLDRALRRLHSESGLPHFDRLQSLLTGEANRGDYARIASELRASEGSLKVAVHRLRKRFRNILPSEIASTVVTEDQVEEEICFLMHILSSGPAEP
jgi:RNA polymerase sigma-70 factor (ECF subfamily)